MKVARSLSGNITDMEHRTGENKYLKKRRRKKNPIKVRGAREAQSAVRGPAGVLDLDAEKTVFSRRACSRGKPAVRELRCSESAGEEESNRKKNGNKKSELERRTCCTSNSAG
jgi:hypothetical protein